MRLIFMFIAIALAAGAFFITMQYTSREPEKPVAVAEPTVTAPVVVKPQIQVQKDPEANIYTARRDIPIGTILTADMLDIQPWPEHLILPEMQRVVAGEPSDIMHTVVRVPFVKGEPIVKTKLANEKDPSYLAAAVTKGMRVVTIGVDVLSGVGGFIYPGDRVDVLITHSIASGMAVDAGAQGGHEAAKQSVTEVLLPNIRVMAVNQKIIAHGGEPPVVPTSVTLEVLPVDAQKLLLAENNNGKLSLALRSLKEGVEKPQAQPTLTGDLTQVNESSPLANGSVTVVRGVTAQPVEVSQP